MAGEGRRDGLLRRSHSAYLTGAEHGRAFGDGLHLRLQVRHYRGGVPGQILPDDDHRRRNDEGGEGAGARRRGCWAAGYSHRQPARGRGRGVRHPARSQGADRVPGGHVPGRDKGSAYPRKRGARGIRADRTGEVHGGPGVQLVRRAAGAGKSGRKTGQRKSRKKRRIPAGTRQFRTKRSSGETGN